MSRTSNPAAVLADFCTRIAAELERASVGLFPAPMRLGRKEVGLPEAEGIGLIRRDSEGRYRAPTLIELHEAAARMFVNNLKKEGMIV